MTFQNPEYLYLLILLLPIVIWYFVEMRHSDASLQISSHQNLRSYSHSFKLKLRHLPFVFRVLSISFLIIALARPQASNSWRTQNSEGIDIMLAMDISATMCAEDLKPNRIESAKAVAMEFIFSRPNDNIGLVVFAGESFAQCPLTTDHAVLVNMFKGVKFGLLQDGTAIGLGLANAVNRIKDSKSKSRVVILLTDGSNNCGDISPSTAAEIAKTFGVRVYTIGVGSHGIVNIPVPTPIGVQYQQMKSEFDELTLKDIAKRTGGKYFRAVDVKSLRNIYKEIDQMEKSKISVHQYSKKSERYFLFSLLAFIFLFLEVLLKNTMLKKIP
jgi:Ca-activated chloride channel family protein